MKFTHDQLLHMTDFQLNSTLATLLGLNLLPDEDPLHNDTAAVYHNGCNSEEYNGTNIDYCNNVLDIMHLSFQYKIGCIPCGYKELWKARDVNADFEVFSTNPLRAITCCLILLLQHLNNIS